MVFIRIKVLATSKWLYIYILKYFNVWLVGDMSSIKLFVEILNASLCLPAEDSDQVMATSGEISYIYHR